jgi:hypothetical protein
MTARVNMAFSRPQNYDSLQHHDPPAVPVALAHIVAPAHPALPPDHNPPADPPHADPPRRSMCMRQPAQAGYNAPTSTSMTAIPTKRVPVAERWTYVPEIPTPNHDAHDQHGTESTMHTTVNPLKHQDVTIPDTIDKVQKSPEWEQWSDACKSELKSMQELKTHQLMALPQGQKAIGSKWVFMVKADEEGNITQHKARLVMQGYTQIEGINYTETFAAIAKYDMVRILLSCSEVRPRTGPDGHSHGIL